LKKSFAAEDGRLTDHINRKDTWRQGSLLSSTNWPMPVKAFFGILHHAQESSNLRYLDLIAEEGDMHWPFQSIAREVDLDNH
jgi:hypothetical protein